MHPSPLRPTALSPQKKLPRWRPRDTPCRLGLLHGLLTVSRNQITLVPLHRDRSDRVVQRVPQTHAIQVGSKIQTPHRGFIFIPGEFRDLSNFTAPENICCVRTLSCVGSSMPVSSRPSVSIIVGCSIRAIRLISIACIISLRGFVRSLSCSPERCYFSACGFKRTS